MQAIRTRYRNILFRSKLEAEWAKFFDSLSIPWIYEPEGFQFSDGTRYLPDFYLPDAHQWFEVKGIMENYDKHKIEMLALATKKDVVVGFSDGKVEMCDVGWLDDVFGLWDWDAAFLNDCPVCGKKCFITGWGSYRCRCCDAYDGDHYLNPILDDYSSGNGIDRDAWIQRAMIDVWETNNTYFRRA